MSKIEYRYAIDFFSQGGVRLGSLPVEPDWGPARECAQFLAIRRGVLPPLLRDGAGTVEPVWDSDCGAPVLSAARVVVAAEDGEETVCEEIPSLTYFRGLAQQGSSAMVERGLLEKGQLYRYRVCAYPRAARDGEPEPSEPDAFQVEDINERLPLEEGPIEPFLAGARACGTDGDPSDMRVFIHQQVADGVMEKSREAAGVETGGVLVGKLHRCASSPEMFLEVTAQIPAAHTDQRAARLTFTAESWAAVRAAIALRHRGELIGGWWHFHPDFCSTCPEETRRTCLMSRPFFSAEDAHMHRTVFPRAFHVALLVSDHGGESLELNLFGWRHGVVSSRGFDLLGADGGAKAAS